MRYWKGIKYQLAETEVYWLPYAICAFIKERIAVDFIELTPAGKLTLRWGFAWDGTSGPIRDTKATKRGSQAHDALCKLMRHGFLPPEAKDTVDDIALHYWTLDKVWRLKRWIMRRGLQKVDFYVDPENKKKVYEAP